MTAVKKGRATDPAEILGLAGRIERRLARALELMATLGGQPGEAGNPSRPAMERISLAAALMSDRQATLTARATQLEEAAQNAQASGEKIAAELAQATQAARAARRRLEHSRHSYLLVKQARAAGENKLRAELANIASQTKRIEAASQPSVASARLPQAAQLRKTARLEALRALKTQKEAAWVRSRSELERRSAQLAKQRLELKNLEAAREGLDRRQAALAQEGRELAALAAKTRQAAQVAGGYVEDSAQAVKDYQQLKARLKLLGRQAAALAERTDLAMSQPLPASQRELTVLEGRAEDESAASKKTGAALEGLTEKVLAHQRAMERFARQADRTRQWVDQGMARLDQYTQENEVRLRCRDILAKAQTLGEGAARLEKAALLSARRLEEGLTEHVHAWERESELAARKAALLKDCLAQVQAQENELLGLGEEVARLDNGLAVLAGALPGALGPDRRVDFLVTQARQHLDRAAGEARGLKKELEDRRASLARALGAAAPADWTMAEKARRALLGLAAAPGPLPAYAALLDHCRQGEEKAVSALRARLAAGELAGMKGSLERARQEKAVLAAGLDQASRRAGVLARKGARLESSLAEANARFQALEEHLRGQVYPMVATLAATLRLEEARRLKERETAAGAQARLAQRLEGLDMELEETGLLARRWAAQARQEEERALETRQALALALTAFRGRQGAESRQARPHVELGLEGLLALVHTLGQRMGGQEAQLENLAAAERNHRFENEHLRKSLDLTQHRLEELVPLLGFYWSLWAQSQAALADRAAQAAGLDQRLEAAQARAAGLETALAAQRGELVHAQARLAELESQLARSRAEQAGVLTRFGKARMDGGRLEKRVRAQEEKLAQARAALKLAAEEAAQNAQQAMRMEMSLAQKEALVQAQAQKIDRLGRLVWITSRFGGASPELLATLARLARRTGMGGMAEGLRARLGGLLIGLENRLRGKKTLKTITRAAWALALTTALVFLAPEESSKATLLTADLALGKTPAEMINNPRQEALMMLSGPVYSPLADRLFAIDFLPAMDKAQGIEHAQAIIAREVEDLAEALGLNPLDYIGQIHRHYDPREPVSIPSLRESCQNLARLGDRFPEIAAELKPLAPSPAELAELNALDRLSQTHERAFWQRLYQEFRKLGNTPLEAAAMTAHNASWHRQRAARPRKSIVFSGLTRPIRAVERMEMDEFVGLMTPYIDANIRAFITATPKHGPMDQLDIPAYSRTLAEDMYVCARLFEVPLTLLVTIAHQESYFANVLGDNSLSASPFQIYQPTKPVILRAMAAKGLMAPSRLPRLERHVSLATYMAAFHLASLIETHAQPSGRAGLKVNTDRVAKAYNGGSVYPRNVYEKRLKLSEYLTRQYRG